MADAKKCDRCGVLEDMLSLAIDDIKHTCVTCVRRYGGDACKHAVFVDDGETCVNWRWEYAGKFESLRKAGE